MLNDNVEKWKNRFFMIVLPIHLLVIILSPIHYNVSWNDYKNVFLTWGAIGLWFLVNDIAAFGFAEFFLELLHNSRNDHVCLRCAYWLIMVVFFVSVVVGLPILFSLSFILLVMVVVAVLYLPVEIIYILLKD